MTKSVVLYVVCLLLATVVNKFILVDELPAPQVHSLFRMFAIIVLLWIGRLLKLVQFPPLHWGIVRTLLPLPVIYLSLMITILTPSISLSRPMAAVSRRLIAVITMVLEEKVLGIQASQSVKYSVITMMTGAIISALYDIYPSWYGSYIIIVINNIVSAANGVYLKNILDSKELNIWGLLFYDACLMIVPHLFMTWASDGFQALLESADELSFWYQLLISCAVDIVLTYGMMVCTRAHSALTAKVISNMWSIFVTYIMLMVLKKIALSWNMFLGINISLMGAIMYMCAHYADDFQTSDANTRRAIRNIQDAGVKVDAPTHC